MPTITISRREMRAILKQARREQEAQDAGYSCHAEYVLAHREQRHQALLARRDQLRADRVACA